jgi:hypothetical protein
MRSTTILAVLTAVLLACGDDSGGGSADATSGADASGADATPADAGPGADADTRDILVRLNAIPGLTATEITTMAPGYRAFDMEFTQPADHKNPTGQTFQQHITLLHIDAAAPMVLQTSGYGVSPTPRRSEPTRLLSANQLSVEHRFFQTSRPDPADWSLLTIQQSAADFHAIRVALAPIYGGAWIGTGASKGGMTSIYHRRFYPADLAGTVAYVAPMMNGNPDPRFVPFVENDGDPTCSANIVAWQRATLLQRNEIENLVQADATSMGWTFDMLTLDVAFEHATLETSFIFWQYFDASMCPMVPAAGATASENYAFLQNIADISGWNDDALTYYEPFYYQSGVQLGYPGIREDFVSDILVHPGTDTPRTYVPASIDMTFDPTAMPDVAQWLSTDASQMLLIYGENDPWSAGMADLGTATDSFELVNPAGNHGSSINGLSATDKATALDALSRWTGVSIPTMKAALAAGPDEDARGRRDGEPRLRP